MPKPFDYGYTRLSTHTNDSSVRARRILVSIELARSFRSAPKTVLSENNTWSTTAVVLLETYYEDWLIDSTLVEQLLLLQKFTARFFSYTYHIYHTNNKIPGTTTEGPSQQNTPSPTAGKTSLYRIQKNKSEIK